MAQYPIKNLGAVGVIADISPTDLPPNGFTDAINARFVDGRVFKIGGNAPTSFVEEDKSIIPLSIQSVPFDFFSGGNSFNIIGTNTNLYKLDDNSLEKINRWSPYRSTSATADVNVRPVIQSIDITDNSLQLKLGEEKEVVAKISPEGVRQPKVIWSVSNESYATITQNPDDPLRATVKANNTSTGQVTITVTTEDMQFSDSIVANIVPNIDSMYLDKYSMQIRNGKTGSLVVAFTPPDAPDQEVTWVTSDASVCTITVNPTDKHRITINSLRRGKVVVSAFMTNSPEIRVNCDVQVIAAIDYIFLDKASLTTNQNVTTDTLTVGFYPEDPANKNVTWAVTTGANICSVVGSGTTVTLKYSGVGTAIVQVTSEEGGATAQCAVTIRAAGASFALASRFFAVLANPIVSKVTIDPSNVDIDVAEEITLKAVVEPAGIENLIYRWKVNKGGIVSFTESNKPEFVLTGKKKGNVTVTVTVYDTRQDDYLATPDRTWYHTVISNCVVATTFRNKPQVKEFDAQYFDDLPGWGDQTEVDADGNISIENYDWKCERVRAFNNRLFALNMRETTASGVTVHYPLRLRWSNFAEENKAPFLWDDFADLRDPDTDNNVEGTLQALRNGYAGYIDLADSNGNLIDMLPLKDYLFVYTEFETYVGTPTMNAYQPLTFKKLFNDSGILAPECVTEVEGSHFVVTQNDIILHNGATKKSIASNRVKKKIIQEVSQINPLATKVHLHSDKKEVWITYVAPGSDKESWYCNKAAIWNYEFDTWSFCEIPYSYDIALVDPPVLEKSATWDDLSDVTWDSEFAAKTPWQKDSNNFHKRITIVASAAKGFFEVDVGALNHIWSPDNEDIVREVPLEMKVERYGIDFDNATDEWNQKHITCFRPQVNGQGTLDFVAGGTQYTNEKGHYHSKKSFEVGVDRKVNVRLNHPYLYYEIYDSDVDSNASVNSIIIEYVVGGRR